MSTARIILKVMHIIIGLGNPGKKYEETRHNAGWLLLDEIAREKGLSWKENKKFKAEMAEDGEMILVKPLTFMNNSGETASAILRYYHLIPRSLFGIKKQADLTSVLTIVHDELDLPLGTFKLATNSGSAGHNGVQSIIDHLKTKNFRRLRIGISTEARKQIPSDKFVLQGFNPAELQRLKNLLPDLTKTL